MLNAFRMTRIPVNNTVKTIRGASKLAPSRVSGVLLGVALLAIGLVSVGCDGRPSRVPVSGKVTVNGEPLEVGSITFYAAAGGRPGGTSLGEGGSYSITMYELNDGLPPGKYLVAVAAADWISDKAMRWHAPKHYQDVKTSGLTAEIKNKTTTLNFDLTWEDDSHDKPWVEKF